MNKEERELKRRREKRKKVNMIVSIVLIVLMLLSMILPSLAFAMYKWDGAYLTYGAGLSESQQGELEKILQEEVNIDEEIEKVRITGDDYLKYGGFKAKDSSLYSSALIVKKRDGNGVNVIISTPDNITDIKDHQYMNAAITSGIVDSDIYIASPVRVTGESALVGIYKALEEAGVEVNEEAAKVSKEELSLINEIDKGNGEEFDSENFSLALAEIKEVLASLEDRETLTEEQVEKIVDEALSNYSIKLTEEEKAKLMKWVDKFRDLEIDWDSVKGQLEDFGDKLSKKINELYEAGKESGFFQKVKEFFKKLIVKVKDYFVIMA